MARAAKKTKTKGKTPQRRRLPGVSLLLKLRWWIWRSVAVVFLLAVALVVLGAVMNPPTNVYMFSEGRRLGGVEQTWVPLEQVAPAMARSAVAAEDANFCDHWGFDLPAIKLAIAEGSSRGASTISQQTVKNVYLWQGRAWVRKAAEAMLTPLVEAVWSKRRIIEVYLNIAEFDEGVFGVEAAAVHYFGVNARDLTDTQAARLAAVLPSPKKRSARNPSNFVRKRARQIRDGAATIRADGRAACFES
ncbi:Peptidoglycan transglycosylase [Sulfitobacter noctilucicola]|uniref:Biosynthetic peptidoglycan transglycosylase n=1 Tax=Sulfitobacter noctilucicola TaxID=1342301 RepID=A0A7W6M5F1_9RHOB|nr:monofunctional biosynthetic peptidoglycan transglycosylase [Sulfitobacter noctilucicola]KIN62651.1 Peptidoglycan transglycosylase [Sulfitobacter noctilucicola]MBB4172815.1 monofunctional biosynthetic peptidoglycan transglycosylase [Sulfitobacter noctilucicola]